MDAVAVEAEVDPVVEVEVEVAHKVEPRVVAAVLLHLQPFPISQYLRVRAA